MTICIIAAYRFHSADVTGLRHFGRFKNFLTDSLLCLYYLAYGGHLGLFEAFFPISENYFVTACWRKGIYSCRDNQLAVCLAKPLWIAANNDSKCFGAKHAVLSRRWWSHVGTFVSGVVKCRRRRDVLSAAISHSKSIGPPPIGLPPCGRLSWLMSAFERTLK